MICENCKNIIPDGQGYCTYCGTVITPAVGQGYQQQGLTKKDFYHHPNMKGVKGEIRGCGIALYIFAVINVVASLTLNMSSMFDAILLLVFGLVIHLARSRVASILFMVYAVINVVLAIVVLGAVRGWWFLVVGYIAIANTFKFHKAWKEYCRTGIVPIVTKKKK